MKSSQPVMAAMVCSALVMVVTRSEVKAQSVTHLDAQIGSITGTVTGPDGKPLASALVRIMAGSPQAGGLPNNDMGEKSVGGSTLAGGPTVVGNVGDVVMLGRGQSTVAMTRTDTEGKFKIPKIRTGNFKAIVPATVRTDMATADVTVEAGKTATVELKVVARTAK